MKSQRWREIEDLYHLALEDRAVLDRANPELRREVESLLAQHASKDGPLDRPAADVPTDLLSPRRLSIGSQLGPYRIDGTLGEGGMGAVYKAHDTRLGRDVAIKVSSERFSDRFEREARAIAALNHPHICQLFDVGPDYLVMELVAGEPLTGPMPPARAVEYASQILDALDAAHRKGIIHRDLKPANILLTKQGIKLLDFGLAKQSSPIQESDPTRTALTEAGQILGTLQYMSPEQLQAKPADARSDLFSFGCVLYEILSGKRAFRGPTTPALMAAILHQEPEPINVTGSLQRVVDTCLKKDPDQRFQNALDLKRDLGWALEQSGESTSSAPVSSRRMWIASAASLALGGLGGWAVLRLRQTPADEQVWSLQVQPPEGSELVFGTETTGFSVSPDGRTVAYIATNQKNAALWVRPLNSTATRLIAGSEGAGYPFWSPDSKSLAFFTQDKLQKVDLAGGTPQTICEIGAARGGAWSSDGKVVFGAWGSSLFQVDASGGKATPLTNLDSSREEIFHYWPQILPGGRFLYFIRSNKPENTGVYAGSFAKPDERIHVLTADNNALYAPVGEGRGSLLWLRGRTLLAQDFDPNTLKLSGEPRAIADPVASMSVHGLTQASVSTTGVLVYSASNPLNQFMRRDRTGRPLGPVGEPAAQAFFRLSPDGGRIAVTRGNSSGADVWLLDVERGVPSRLTSLPAANVSPIWSRNGGSIVFASGIASRFNLYLKAADGASGERRLTQSPNPQGPDDLSLGDRFLLYEEGGSDKHNHLWFLETPFGGSPPKPYARTSFNEWAGVFSPDGRWVAFHSDESGRYEVYVAAFPEPRGRTTISTSGGLFPIWNHKPGATELFYVSADSKLMSVNLKLGAAAVEPLTPRELFSVPVFDEGVCPYDTADGQTFFVLETPAHATQPLTVIVNWPTLLKKSTEKQ